MSTRFVADDLLIANVQGLRWVRRVDKKFVIGGQAEYCLEVKYEGGDACLVEYKSAEDRDKMFGKLRRRLTEPV